MIYFCCDERRREAVRRHTTLNGIDYLEVDQNEGTLYVTFIKPMTDTTLTPANILIRGGERITNVAATHITVGTDNAGNPANVLSVQVNAPGDFSIYTLRLIRNAEDLRQPDHFDPLLSTVDFSFKIDCPNDFDCLDEQVCPPEARSEPEIDYLAKDYTSLRQLMLDRMAVLLPQWKERNPADLGIVLVELLAYVGDYLSYQQDAIATEAYLGTAHRRISVRRHARFVDYFMHDGSNARVWVQVQVNTDLVKAGAGPSPLPQGTQFFTRLTVQPVHISSNPSTYAAVLALNPEVFETMEDVDELYQAHNELTFYTWGAHDCCLPKGATNATLQGHLPNLNKGDVLIFEEVRGPQTGVAADADPTHRCAVRLTDVRLIQDPLGGQFQELPNDNSLDVTEIEWHSDDALPFPLCISSTLTLENGDQLPIDDVSVARGNIVLADAGRSIPAETLEPVPASVLSEALVPSGNRCEPHNAVAIYPRYRPHLQGRPLTHAVPYDATKSPPSASAVMNWSVSDTLPVIKLSNSLDLTPKAWTPLYDLLGSGPTDKYFVVETETDGSAYLRFGDDKYGLRPEPESIFTADYRVGNGVRGNVGAESIAHILIDNPAIVSVRNPLAARGGAEPESSEDVRQKAPSAFRIQERAVTQQDYAEVAQRDPTIQRAAATFRWTGSWRTVFLSVDREGGVPVNDDFKTALYQRMDKYRMAGYDMEIDDPLYVSLEINMTVCVLPDYFRSHVKAALLQVFSSRILPDGRRGVFHSDNFTFGQPVYLSPLYAAVMAVEGVSFVQITLFQRQDRPDPQQIALANGKLEMGRMEIARLDNDPNFPEHGVFRLTMEGGK
ncbi:MAG: putative baseplate assembly protein [Chloroflexi bacterium]|nr:MAG: putative baseplate assembly protein [Chloroflexota bacterium]